jgi:hypothetical protein
MIKKRAETAYTHQEREREREREKGWFRMAMMHTKLIRMKWGMFWNILQATIFISRYFCTSDPKTLVPD